MFVIKESISNHTFSWSCANLGGVIISLGNINAEKIKDFFSKCDQTCSFLEFKIARNVCIWYKWIQISKSNQNNIFSCVYFNSLGKGLLEFNP